MLTNTITSAKLVSGSKVGLASFTLIRLSVAVKAVAPSVAGSYTDMLLFSRSSNGCKSRFCMFFSLKVGGPKRLTQLPLWYVHPHFSHFQQRFCVAFCIINRIVRVFGLAQVLEVLNAILDHSLIERT